MRRLLLVLWIGSACRSFGAEADPGSVVEAGTPPTLSDSGDAEPDTGLARMIWNFDESPDAGHGFSYPNKTGDFVAERDTEACPSAPGCFRSVVRPAKSQSAGRWGFRPYSAGAGAKPGRYRISFDFEVDCSHGDPNARSGIVELYCADAPTSAVAGVSVGGATDGGTSGPLRVFARYKSAPGAAAQEVYNETGTVRHKKWQPLVLDVVFGAEGALSFKLDGTAPNEIPDHRGKGLGCPGSNVALQVGAVDTFGSGATGECIVRYDNIVFEYPPNE